VIKTRPFNATDYLTDATTTLTYLQECLRMGGDALFYTSLLDIVANTAVHDRPKMREEGKLLIRIVVEAPDGDGVDRVIADYVMNHNDPQQRRVLGEQCRNAFEANQSMFTYPED
jgi:hypothetical protein